jgi:hypothetical protein
MRITIKRRNGPRLRELEVTERTLDIFQRMKRMRCTCAPFEIDWGGEYWKRSPEPPCSGCQQWDELHSQLCDHHGFGRLSPIPKRPARIQTGTPSGLTGCNAINKPSSAGSRSTARFGSASEQGGDPGERCSS